MIRRIKSSGVGISKYPSGFFSSLAVFAAVFEYATPTEQVSPCSSSVRCLMRLANSQARSQLPALSVTSR